MKKTILILSIILLFFTACDDIKESFASTEKITTMIKDTNQKDQKLIIENPVIRFLINNEENRIDIASSYFDKNIDFEKIVKVFDSSNNIKNVEIYYGNGWLSILGDFKKDVKYKIKIDGTIKPSSNMEITYNNTKIFTFKSEDLLEKDIYSEVNLKDLKSAHFTLTFNSGNILSKDIRSYIEFVDNIDYSYTIRGNKLYIYGDFKANKNYKYNLKKGFEVGSSILKKDMRLVVSFGDINKSINFTDYKSYVSSYSEAIDIQTTNVKVVAVEIIKINTENLNYLNIFKKNYLTNKYYQEPYYFDSFGESVQKYKRIIAYEKNKIVNSQLNFNDKLIHKDDGIYLVLIKDVKDEYIMDSKLIFKSDLGISTKVAKDQMFFSIRSLASNKLIEDASIFVYNNKNTLLFKGKTNSDGIYKKDYTNVINSSPALVVVKKDNQVNFLNLSNSISAYDILNDNIKNQSEYDSLVFMERSLLRPSDSANILISVKNKDFKSLKNQIVYLQFIDPTQKELFTKELILNEVGIAEYKFTSFNNYKTGKYRINVLLGKNQIAYKEFYVEAFIPEKIEVKIESQKDEYLLDENIDFNIKSKYLFGTPANGLKFDMEIMANTSNYISDKFKDFSFNNSLDKNKQLVSSSIKESGTLDENGYKNFNKKLKLNKTSNSLIKTSLIATVFDDGRAVRKFKDISIYPFDMIVGIKKDFKGSVKTDEAIFFDTILVNPSTKKEVNSIERLNVKVFKKFYHYYAGVEIREIESYSINSNEKIKVIPKESGEYYVLVETSKGQISSETFYASGWNYDPVNIKDKSSYKVSLKTDKELYNEGDIINIDLKSPISGKLLLTIEEDKIIDYKIIELNSTTAVLSIPMNKNIKKGAYIKAQVIRSTETKDDIFPFRVIGSKYIRKDNKDKKININMETLDLYKSGEEVEIKINTNSKNSYMVVSMVDMGILNIINEKPIDAFRYFDKKNKDNISLYDLYSNLQKINKLKAESVSGDGIDRKREKHISPDSINERVKPLSFWSKIIKLDEEGKGIAKFKLPNFNGEVLIQSLVVNDSKIASSNKKVTIKDDIVIKPTLPRFLIRKDEVSIPIRLLNTTNEVQKINLSLNASANLILEKDSVDLILEAKSSKVVDVKINAEEKGLSKLIFKVSNNKDIFTNETSIYVKDNLDYKIISKSGIVNTNTIKDIKILDSDTKNLNKEVKAYIGIDNSPFSKLNKSTKYLISYAHGCAEQTSSKLLAMLMSEKFIDKNDTKLLFERNMFIKKGIDKLISMQNYSGMFTYWRGGNSVNNYASFYTTYVLQMLSENGFEVPKDVLDNAFEAHWNIFKNEYKDLDFFSAYASKKNTNFIYDNHMYGNTLTSYISLAVSMKKYENTLEYKTLIDEAKKYFYSYDMNRPRTYSGSFYSPIKDIASSLFLYSEYINSDVDDEFSQNLLRTLNKYINSDELYSTQDRAFVMLALSSYYKNIDISNSDINATIQYENELIDVSSKIFEEISVKNKDSISINNKGGLLNYIVDINKAIDLEVNDNKVSEDDPIYIKSDIIGENGNIVNYNEIKLGDKLFMKVSVKSKERIENVAVNIQIPSGLEIINPRLYKSNNQKFENINYYPDYEDYRDDRVLTYLTTTSDKKTFYIPLIATTKGNFIYPASYIEAMYDSRLNSYYKASKGITIK